MAKSADAFRTISEVADWLETPAHVLRFWESKFSQVKPVKRAGGRRYYRPQDMKLLGGIKKLLHDDGMTIKGVQKLLREQGVKYVAALSQPLVGEEAQAIPMPPPAAEPDAAQVLSFRPKGITAPQAKSEADAEPAAEPETTATSDAEQTPITDESDEVAADEATTLADGPPSAIPGFLSRPGAGSIKADPPKPIEPAPIEAAPQAETPAPAPRKVVVAPDPGDDIDAEPGVFPRIVALARPISGAAAQELAPFIDRLRATLDKTG